MRKTFALLFTLLATTTLSAQVPVCSPDSFHKAQAQRDFQAVQEFVNSKRTIPLDDKDCNLALAGDVRFNYASIFEKLDGQQLRGTNGTARQDKTGLITNQPPIGGVDGTGVPFSFNNFQVEVNLYLDYVCGRSWAVGWIEFANDAGISQNSKTCEVDPEGLYGSGCSKAVCLRKAYMGYNVYADGCSRFDVELGRRPLYTIFDSRVQFQSNMDGLVLKYAQRAGNYGDFYLHGAGFVVDERTDHFAYIVEAGLLNCRQAGFDIRYSFIDWQSLLDKSRNRCDVKDPLGSCYRISQLSLAYNFCALNKPAKFYGAVLYNHAAKEPYFNQANPASYRRDSSKNLAWYAGFIIGEVCGPGDWALDINYQYVEAYAIPDADISGIGRNGSNLLNNTMTSDGRGFANYKGIRIEGLYAFTNNLSIDARYEMSADICSNLFGITGFVEDDPIFSDVAGPHRYSKFEVEAIYAF